MVGATRSGDDQPEASLGAGVVATRRTQIVILRAEILAQMRGGEECA